jgi:hypothetical protein
VTRRIAILLALALAAPGLAEEVVWKPAPVEPAAKFGPPQPATIDSTEVMPRPRALPRIIAEPALSRNLAPDPVVRTQFATERYAASQPSPVVISCEPPPLPPSSSSRRPRFIWEALSQRRVVESSQFVPRSTPAPIPVKEPAARLAIPKP